MAAWVEASTRDRSPSAALINQSKTSLSASLLSGDARKPAMGPKPHLMPKPFALQRNATIHPIKAPKINSGRQLLRAASSDALDSFTSSKSDSGETHVQKTSESVKPNGTFNVFDRSAAPKPAPLSPKPALTPKSAPSKNPDITQTAPEDGKNVQSRVRAKSLGSQDQKAFRQKPDEESRSGEADVKASSPCWPARNCLSVELTSRFESSEREEVSSVRRDDPPLSPSTSKPQEDEEISGCSIKRRISLLFDRSTASRHRDTVNKKDSAPAEISEDIKQRIKNLSLNSHEPRVRLPSSEALKSQPNEKAQSDSVEIPAQSSPLQKSTLRSADEEEDEAEEDKENYVSVPLYRRVGMANDQERKTQEDEDKQRQDEQLKKERERDKHLQEERKLREEIERRQEEQRKRAEEERRLKEERKQEEEEEEEKQRQREELRKQEVERQKRIEEKRKLEEERKREAERERQGEQERLEREKQIDEQKKRVEEKREKERLRKEKEMEEERQKIKEERQREEQRLRQEREKEEKLKKEREMEEKRRLEEEERLRQEREMERLRKEREMEEKRRLEEEERLRQEREMERLRKEREMEEKRRLEEEERLRQEREMERLRKEREMEEKRRLEEEERLRQEREMERLRKEREMEEKRRLEKEEKLRKERELERQRKEREMEEKRQLEEQRLRQEREMEERLKKEREIKERRRLEEEERLRQEREMERLRKEREMEERRRIEEKRLRDEREEKLKKDREMEERRSVKEEKRWRQEREKERLRMETLRSERNDVAASSDLIRFDADETWSEVSSQVLYDDFSVKPRRWGTGTSRSSTPSPSREARSDDAVPDWLESRSHDPESPRLNKHQNTPSKDHEISNKPKSIHESETEDLTDSQTSTSDQITSHQGELKTCDDDDDERYTEMRITDEFNNTDDDDDSAENKVNRALQRFTSQEKQRKPSIESNTPEICEPEPLLFPELSAPLLDSSVFRSKVDLGKKRSIKRLKPSRAVRQRAALPALTEGSNPDWRFCDSTDAAKAQCSNGQNSESEESSRDATPTPAPSQPKRVPLFPGMDQSALMAQLKRRSGLIETNVTEAQTASARSPRTPTLGPRVLPPVDSRDSGSGSSPSWLLELKSKKRLSQPESDA